MVSSISEPQSGGRVILDSQNNIVDIKEGKHGAGSVIATGLYVLNADIFNLPLVSAGNLKQEFGLPQTLMQMENKMKAVFATFWYQVAEPKDLDLHSSQIKRLQLNIK